MKKRLLSAALTLAMLVSSALPMTAFAAGAEDFADVTGSIKATLRFDYPQLLTKVSEKNINVTLYKDGEEIAKVPFEGERPDGAQVTLRNVDGAELTNEPEIGYFDVSIPNLPLGIYSFGFEGDGYTAYKTPDIEIDDYSKHVVLGTGDETFSIGDINGDGRVTSKDRDMLSDSLGRTDSSSLETYDLNGDGKIDIVDLAYVNHQIKADGDLEVYDTALIAQKVIDTAELEENLRVTGGNAESIFKEDNEEAVMISTLNNSNELSIPIELSKASEMEEIEVISPDVDGALIAGEAEVTYIDENGAEVTESIAFDYSMPEGVEPLNEREGTTGVTIVLGKRVAVKKIIIHVSKVKGDEDAPTFTVIQEVKFLKDIVPENPLPQVLNVKNVKADPKNESVRLTWDKFPNVTGYTVYYGLKSGEYDGQLTVNTNSALISGLKNLKTYYFTVTPISDGWEGNRSEVVSAMPMPNSKPRKPDMVRVSPMDGALSVAWKETENATYYKVFYKEQTEEEFKQWGDRITSVSTAIGGLTNGTEYLIYIIAGNDIGEGPQSDMAIGIPEKQEVVPPEIPTLNKIDSSNIEKIEMENPNNVKVADYPNGFDVKNVADDDYATHWTARAWWESMAFTFTFTEAKEMNYMVYVPRLDGRFRKSLERYSITVWDEYGNEETLVNGRYIAINSTESGYMILPFEKRTVKKLKVALAQWAGSPTGVSLAEAIFYESDNLEAEVRELFADDTYTELSETAKANKTETLSRIGSLRAQANDADGYYVDKEILLDELNLAEELLNGNRDSLGVIRTGFKSRSAAYDAQRYSQAGSELQPAGVTAFATEYAVRNKKPQTEVVVYAHIPEGETAYLVPTQYFAEANDWQGSGIPLQNGRNIIEIPKMGSQTSERGGALYLKYSGSSPEEILLHFRQGAIEIPMLELSDWYSISQDERENRIAGYVEKLRTHTAKHNMTQTSIANATEISMPNVLLSVPADKVLSAITPGGAEETLYNNVLAWEDLMHILNTTQGIDNTYENSDMESRQNIRYMRMFGNAFMYAAGSHIGIGYGSVSGVVCGKPISMLGENATANSLFGWGIAHEIGHNMDKLGKAEITNNIYSLMAQTYDGKENILPSRLELSGKYQSIYDKVALGRPGISNDVFVQLGMYWQLHLAYDDGDNPLDFYNRLFKEWKSGKVYGATSDGRFAVIASNIAGRDLRDFFESWGVRLSDESKEIMAEYPAETRSIQYLTDASRRYRLNGGAAGKGITMASAKLDPTNEKQINLTFSTTADEESVLGYEIRRNGKKIAFVTGNEYTDIIGSANNMAFGYSVQAFDMLGNKIGVAAEAGQVRISYTSTVDKNSYTQTTNSDGTVSIIMNEETDITGIKVTNPPKSGRFTVEVKSADGEFITAKTDSFANNESEDSDYFVSYLNKPGTDSSDTRMWTYTAKEVKISGLPDGAEAELIDYPGDNIAFTDGAVIGRLGSDYVYGDGEDDVIKAGTLIVTGAYRGDPMYNTVQINGRFIKVDPETEKETVTERAISGYSLLFAEIPKDGKVSDISDGIFVFVPDVQKEAELQGDTSDCSAESLLPAQIKAELYRTDEAESTDSKRLTSDTIWIDSPANDAMPVITIQ